MNFQRLITFGFDPQTGSYLRGVLAHPFESVYRLCRRLSVDDDRAQRELLQNLALGLPDRAAGPYADELAFLAQFPRDPYSMFPYPLQGAPRAVESGVDASVGLPYVVHEGRRFYGPKDQSVDDVVRSYRYFTEDEGLLGQGRRTKSPHAYTDAFFTVEAGDVVVDIGCSDALFAFHHAPAASRLYLFESWSRWKPALTASFAPYREKTTILDKFVTDRTEGRNVRLVDAVAVEPGARYFIKMDIEGGERAVLAASRDFLQANKVKLSCCVYHRQDDAEAIAAFLKELGYSVRFSAGWMLPLVNGVHFPYFRHGVLYARNDGVPA